MIFTVFCCREPSYYRFVQIKFCITFFCSKHIFQVDDVWIDKRTLALSMRSGCWFNSFAMSAFCKMFNHEQKERLKLRQRNLDELTYFYMNKKIGVCLLHFVHFFNYSFNIRSNFIFYISYGQDLLMTNSLFHNDVRVYFTESYLGIKLDVVDHVRTKFCS